ncbi:hypothetical protein KIN20_002684 [Parelaphostrongylus tenuis]|uniref:Uncharacterized protein n=1 Tax=Parelaphostrongylus tenuis TaxID=148309 RepID=A0AAD5MEJ7_PARTN|nr:hypothetical protein KIN20_002684 [Parelaphostrongylus tenuis]
MAVEPYAEWTFAPPAQGHKLLKDHDDHQQLIIYRETRNHLYVHLTFNEHGEEHKGRTREKKESSVSRIRVSEKATGQLMDPKLRAHLFDSTILPAL